MTGYSEGDAEATGRLDHDRTVVVTNCGRLCLYRKSPRTLQVVYAASQLGFGPGSTISGLSFRLNGGDPTWPPTSRTDQLRHSTEHVSECAWLRQRELRSEYRAGRGHDAKRDVDVQPNSFPGGATPNSFGPEIIFPTSYLYLGGSLLITIRHTGNGVDSEFADAVASTAGLYQGQGAGSYTATTADGTTVSATVMRFDVNAGVPEPSAILLVLSGLGMLVTLRRTWRSATTTNYFSHHAQ